LWIDAAIIVDLLEDTGSAQWLPEMNGEARNGRDIRHRRGDDLGQHPGPEGTEKPRQHSFSDLVVTAVGTSIDGMAVGVTLALRDADIAINALAIGMATFAMTTMGVLFGRFLGGRFGRFAEAAGGVGLILIGTKILAEHTMLG
jgi:hypothetical protein